MSESSLDELKRRYPYIDPGMIEVLNSVETTESQWEKTNNASKSKIDQLLKQNYGHHFDELSEKWSANQEEGRLERVIIVSGATGAGKSATANTLLGEKNFEESGSAVPQTKTLSGKCRKFGNLVVDTPGSWNVDSPHISNDVRSYFVFVINLASPRFTKNDLHHVRSLRLWGRNIMSSHLCMAVLSHADSTLQKTALKDYVAEVKGDPLHTFLTEDLQGHFLAVNNSAPTPYEREKTQKAILSALSSLQDRAPIPQGSKQKHQSVHLSSETNPAHCPYDQDGEDFESRFEKCSPYEKECLRMKIREHKLKMTNLKLENDFWRARNESLNDGGVL